jgi:hypothetical protein
MVAAGQLDSTDGGSMAAGQINLDAYTDALVVLGTAGIVVPLVQRWRVSPVLGYLAPAWMLGPLGLGSFKDDMFLLYVVTVIDAKNVAEIAELGVVFLLFLIGLELSFDAAHDHAAAGVRAGQPAGRSCRPSSAALPRCSATARRRPASSARAWPCRRRPSSSRSLQPAAPDHARRRTSFSVLLVRTSP